MITSKVKGFICPRMHWIPLNIRCIVKQKLSEIVLGLWAVGLYFSVKTIMLGGNGSWSKDIDGLSSPQVVKQS